MLKIACFCLAVAVTTPLWSQVEPSATGGDFTLDDSRMMTPPPVSGDAYPITVGAENRSNYVSAGLVFTSAYQDNLLAGNRAISDETYAFLPTISLERRTPRQGEMINYSSGVTLYQHTSEFNGVSQNASGGYRFHLSPYAVFVVRDSFAQNYNMYNQGNPFAGGGVTGTPGSPNTVVIAPFANQLNNSSSAAIDYQYGRNAMIGGSGTYSFLNYSNLSQVQGLDNSNSSGAMGFYTRRLSRSQYVGAAYQFAKVITHPIATYTLSHTVFGFYTIYLTRNFSFSILGGPEHYTTWSPNTQTQGAWSPSVEGSFAWQTGRSNVVTSYSHLVSGAGGLIGTYRADTASLFGTVMFSRRWILSGGLNYSNFNNVNSTLAVSEFAAGGKTIIGTGSLQRRLTQRLNLEGGYSHFHESYPTIPAAASAPDSNRVTMSVSYQLNRPLGR
ncbi:MAG TPA: hypothetical protein VGI45_29580 [Terracidiphilus sp.]|jgi:hypothetical protein